MKTIAHFMAVGALALAFSPAVAPAAFAQSQSRSSIVAADHSMSSSKLIGMAIYDQHGQQIGTIADILVKSGKIEPLAVVSVGDYVGNGPKMIAVPLSHIEMNADKASMKVTKSQLAAMPTWQWVGMAGG